ncbi:MAG: hypothetical protein ACR2PG_02995, partial [Hyphomicrobiaceae bacterium]
DDVVEDLEAGKLIELETPKHVDDFVRKTFRTDELILLKGSGSVHFERIALSWQRNVQCWEFKCGRDGVCSRCQFIEHPFEQHGQVSKSPNPASWFQRPNTQKTP